jgi:hypothetical protein
MPVGSRHPTAPRDHPHCTRDHTRCTSDHTRCTSDHPEGIYCKRLFLTLAGCRLCSGATTSDILVMRAAEL